MASTNITKEIVDEIPGWIRVFSDGTIERPLNNPIVPPPQTGLSSKDFLISQNPPLSARLFLPNITHQSDQKLPIYVYFHGGGFFFESTFSKIYTDHFLKLVPLANAVTVSVEYRLAPENPLPAAYHDCWNALQWVASHSSSTNNTNKEPWLTQHGDFNRVFIGGDSAGGNIVHNIAMRAGTEALHAGVKILGAVLVHPFFFGSYPVGGETVEGHAENFCHKVWKFVYPCCPGGLDNPVINPLLQGAPTLDGLGCCRMIVFVAGKDDLGLRERGFTYYEAVKNSDWKGKLEYYEEEEENHVYHILKPQSELAEKMIKRIASFIRE